MYTQMYSEIRLNANILMEWGELFQSTFLGAVYHGGRSTYGDDWECKGKDNEKKNAGH